MAVTPQCPDCKAELPALNPPGGGAACSRCYSPFEAVIYPAAVAPKRLIEPVPAQEGEATCFFHATHRADQSCDQCGRLLCPVCTVAIPSGWACPACALPGGPRKGQRSPERERANYAGIGGLMLLVCLLLIPIAVITGPLTVGVLIYGARQPRSLVRPSILPYWILGALALLVTALSVGFWLMTTAALADR